MTPENATINVSLAHSRFGTPQPQAEIRYPQGTHYRVVRAALLELATPPGLGWVIEIDAFGEEVGRVFLELVDGNDFETERGLALLRRVLG